MSFTVTHNMNSRGPHIIAAHMEFFTEFHRDMIAWIMGQMLENVISGRSDVPGRGRGYVGVVIGDLKKAQTSKSSKFRTDLYPDLASRAAPYIFHVAEWARNKYGDDYYQITLDLYGNKAMDYLETEHKRMLRVLNSGQRYKYENPYPAVEIA